jgi:hypothetical protein
VCNAIYIGQSGRTIRSRIIEHMNDTNSHVHMHMITHGSHHKKNFQWNIRATHPWHSERVAIEALLIKVNTNLMNGCEGARLLQFL